MMEEFQQAVVSRDWETVTALVEQHIDSDRDTSGLMDWLSAGDYSGNETPESVAAEWEALDNQVEGVDY